jgi:alanine racemase
MDVQWRPTLAEVDLDAIAHNVSRLAEITGTGVCAVVKGDGYGHGMVPVARAALAAGAGWLAVALVEEGIGLRDAGIDAPVLVLAEPPPAAVPALLDHALTPVAYSPAFLAALDDAGRAQGRQVPIHVKVDTGMGRVGIPPTDLDARLDWLTAAPGIEVEGLLTHLARADEPSEPTTDAQLDRFEQALEATASHGIRPRIVHAANSAGAIAHPRSRHDLVRVGIAMYGLSPSPQVDAGVIGLRPALRLHSRVSFAKRVEAGTPASYGHRWSAPADGWLATIPIGYADGVPRALTNSIDVLIGGRRRPVAGTVCMDQLLAWCGDDEVATGDEVVLIGAAGDERIRMEDWAAAADTITYEIATQLTARVPRLHVGATA